MRITYCLSVLALILMAATAPDVGQNDVRPDFSGTWVLNPSKSQPAEKIAKRTETLEIARSGQSIRMRFDTREVEAAFTYIPDGRVHVQQVPDVKGESHTLVAQWIGSTLVVDRRTHVEGATDPSGHTFGDVIVIEHWDLSSDGRVLTRLFDQPGGDHRILVYDRDPSSRLR